MNIMPYDLVDFAAIWTVSAFVLYLSARLPGSKRGFVSSFVASFLGAVVSLILGVQLAI